MWLFGIVMEEVLLLVIILYSSGSGRRDYRAGDLRGKLDRRYSPDRRHSPVRDARSHRAFHVQRPLSRDRGNSFSRSPIRRSEREYRRKQHVDGESDRSESLKASDGAENPKKQDKVSTYDKNCDFEEQLKQVQSDIVRLEEHKSQLKNFLEEKIVEEHKLSGRIEDLEIQLNKEQEDCKRITSRIKQFVRAYGRYLKAQEELTRSQTRLQRLGDQLGSDISKSGANEEDLSVNIPSDEDPNWDNRRSPRNGSNEETKRDALSVKKRPYILSATSGETRVGNSQKRGRLSGSVSRSEKIIGSEGPGHLSENYNKEKESKKMIEKNKEVNKSISDDYKRVKNHKSGNVTLDKIAVKGSEVRRIRPSTSIAANAVDELFEANEMEDRSEAMEVTAVYDDNKTDTSYMPLPPPPPRIDLNAYKQYEDDDEDVDVEKVESEMLDFDLNGEVEIE
ncbi:zinc finger CCCH domain-containing protein 13 isoform X2 [Asparagus officinalis]|uniref:zinc finger CCCH domain-containing protein 13 isoform X2 n=1 Tax=Asparagus officinalis TaxID=4686 RepID=UPI00098DFF6C|nr:zinc finger CCCH domain-containing protein 13 isoform X2 [Asparagus officinalis]XP_020268754.1 zinc finger CCCH domain-containing protein 13 isoform X2 [Asparagus officinalis]XP_020268755.1 zinc finger CCCH domain-containing protein 13 isoform X2 [Asparagus officinalis]